MATLMIDFVGGPLDGDTWYGATDAPPVSREAIDLFPNMRPWIVAEIFAETRGQIGQRFTASVPEGDKPPAKFPHVLAVTVNQIGCLVEADYSACHRADYEITERLEHADELLLRVEFRGRSEGPTVVNQRYTAIKGCESPLGWPPPD